MSNTTKNFYILAISLSILHNYFSNSTKLFSDLYPVEIWDTWAKSFVHSPLENGNRTITFGYADLWDFSSQRGQVCLQMCNIINISENAGAHVPATYDLIFARFPNLNPSTMLEQKWRADLSRKCSTCIIICVITGKIAAAHSPGVPLSASTEANIASIRAWTALFTLFCSSFASLGLLGITTDNPAYHPPNVELQMDLKW